jgi:tetratricopeptide (TPR) repeat protein
VFLLNKGDNDNALDYFQKSLNILLKTLGEKHPDVARTYYNIASVCLNKDEYDKALDYFQKNLDIRLKTLGENHPDVAITYYKIASVCVIKDEYDNALDYFQKSLNILLKTFGEEYLDVANLYYYIGFCYQFLEAYEFAVDAFKNAFNINKKGISLFNIAQCYEELSENHTAFEYYLQSAESFNSDPDYGSEHENTKDSVENVIRVAKELNKEDKIPLWMKNYNF